VELTLWQIKSFAIDDTDKKTEEKLKEKSTRTVPEEEIKTNENKNQQ
jgi:hypothetical protein